MKVFLFLIPFLLAPVATAFDVPKAFFDLGSLEEAQKKAAAANQALAFVIVEKEATPTWVDCPGAVSLSASKAVLKFSQGVVVDLAETAALPDKIKEKYEAGGASVPIVIFSDPQLTQTFGRFDYPAMKSQKFSKIFEAAKKEIQAAKDDGTFSNTVEKAVVVEISDSKIETWKSAAGTEIKAKLVGVKNDSIYLFETAEGKTITAKADQLDQDSVTRARKLAGLSD